MEQNRKGRCTNFVDCKNADSNIPIELSIAADFVCPECGRDLMPVVGPKKIPVKNILLIGIPVIVICIALFYYFKIKNTVAEGKGLISKIDTTISNVVKANTNTPPEQTSPPAAEKPVTPPQAVEEKKPVDNTKQNDGNSGTHQKLSVQEYFTKIGLPATKNKVALKAELLSLFASPSVPVIKMNNGKPTNDGTSISAYVESVQMLNKKIKIMKEETTSGKISKIYVSE